MGICWDKITGRKDSEKSKKRVNNVMPDRNSALSPKNVSTLPPIRPANKEKTEHDGHMKSRKIGTTITPSNSSEVMEWTASKKAEEVKSTSERQSYKGKHKQQVHKVNEEIGHTSQFHKSASTKTSFLQLEASKDFQDGQKKRESDTAKWDLKGTPNETKNDTKNPNERPRTTSSVFLEESALGERIVSAKLGRSNNQWTDFEAVPETMESETASVDGMSNTNGSKKDIRPSHSKNDADEKGNDALNADRCTEDLQKKPIKKGRSKRKIKELEDRVTTLTEEKNTLLNRLSEIGAMKLINNNPKITDLSDANRPEKLVEQFAELYDNEWTDAYEHLTKTQAKPMDKSADLLLQSLKEAYKICLSSTNQKGIQLREAMLSYVGLSEEDSIEIELQEIEKRIWEYRKKKSQTNIARVGKEVRERLRALFKQLETELSKSVSIYIDECVRICWYMCIKNPPMHLDFGENEKKTTTVNETSVLRYFNKTKFMSYTKDGEYIHYVVWPALFLHDGGNMMRKGVAQGSPVISNTLVDVKG
ncbi:hypothetical protein CHS0354_035503 [Potamilus streckersoni]|uniref:Mitochondria-eating protein n=1 Tax=Potamilus streckersoni TaxID=2493646 RepID=A0AAE0RVN3_9BIVA|nr:hypothetical protein CHS0354_035503 [Potamilus streckersoni]